MAEHVDQDSGESNDFPQELIDHMRACWAAECENAERLSKKINQLVSVIAILFGLGLFKIEWTYDPKQFSRIQPVEVLWIFKILLGISLGCCVRGLNVGLSRISRKRSPGDEEKSDLPEAASEYLHFDEETITSPPSPGMETRATIFYKYSEAIDLLRIQNSRKSDKVRSASKWFVCGLWVVLAAVGLYLIFGHPPARDPNDSSIPNSDRIQRCSP